MSELSERVATEHVLQPTSASCWCGETFDAYSTVSVVRLRHAAHLTEVAEAAVRETIAAASPSQQWGWGTDGWKPGDPDDFLQPMTAGHNVFTEADVRRNVERFGGIAVVRTIYTAPEPGPWKEAP